MNGSLKHLRNACLCASNAVLFLTAFVAMPVPARDSSSRSDIDNGLIHAVVSLPDRAAGYYRGTRFDWSGVVNSLVYKGHNYYGPWFTDQDPSVIDFIFKGPAIVAGPCSAISGPVEEFSSNGKALGFDDAKPSGTFIKIGVGVLRRPDAQDYNPYRLYDIVDAGRWSVHPHSGSIEFTQELREPSSGYAYRYSKTLRLENGRPEMVLEHVLQNTGTREIRTNVYDHNFLVLDRVPVSPGIEISVPFTLSSRAEDGTSPNFFKVQGNRFAYEKMLSGRDTVAAEFSGFGKSSDDYKITIENKIAGAGMTIKGDRPLNSEHLWSIRTVVAVEPFIEMNIEPGKAFRWKYTYSYYTLPKANQ